MNAMHGIARIKKLRILLGSGYSSTIAIGTIVEKPYLKKYDVIQWHTQAQNITTNLKFKVNFTLPALSAANVVTWNCHMDDSAKGRYDMI